MIDIQAPPPGFTFSFDKTMKDWQDRYEKEASRLTKKMTWAEWAVGEVCAWLLIFKIPQITALLVPICEDLHHKIRECVRKTAEHYRFLRMTPADQQKHIEGMKPSMIKLMLLSGIVVMPFVLGGLTGRPGGIR